MGVSQQASFCDPMRLYVSDTGDKLRTNMYIPGKLPGDSTCTVFQMGFHVSFDVEARYNEFFNTPDGSSFTLNINEEDVHKLNASELQDTHMRVTPKPSYSYGIRLQQDTPKPTIGIPIPTGQHFHVILKTSPEFAHTMKLIDSERWTAYAEIKHFMNVVMTREVQ